MNHRHESFSLAIDQGGQSSRVGVYRRSGELLCQYSAPCATETHLDDVGNVIGVEQNGPEILRGIQDCLERVHEFLKQDCQRITAAGFAGQGSSLLAWNANTGAALSPVLSWQDRRAENQLAHIEITQKNIQQLTGLRLSPHYGATKMRWLLDHNEDVQRAQIANELRIGPIASYLFWHLLRNTKRENNPVDFIDPGHAQRTLLWNLSTHLWEPQLLAAFSIPESILPNCVMHNSDFGNLMVGEHAVPLRSCQRDQGASLFARGLPHANACYINIGTGAFLQRVTNNLTAPDGLLVSPLWLPDPQKITEQIIKPLYAWEATVNGAASALDWLANETGTTITPAVIDNALSQELTRSTNQHYLYLLNAVGGLSAPYWRTDLQSRFGGELTAMEKIQAWIESIIFQLVVNLQLMKTAGPIEHIFISGGLSKADGLCQRLANVSEIKVSRSENAEATLQGIAYTAAGFPDDWVAQQHDEFFYPREDILLRQRFAQWQRAMELWLKRG